MWLLTFSAILSTALAVYGVSALNSKYTCSITKPLGLFDSCKYWMTIPSAILVVLVLLVMIYKGMRTCSQVDWTLQNLMSTPVHQVSVG